MISHEKNGGTVMEFKTLNGLHFGDLTTKLPIIQGGMGVGISLSGLASVVYNHLKTFDVQRKGKL
jgi:hypothetical protein